MICGNKYSLARHIRRVASRRVIGIFRSALATVSLAAAVGTVACDAGRPAATTSSYQSAQPSVQQSNQRSEQQAAQQPALDIRTDIGFRSRNQFNEHFTKHGAEFGQITKQEYLRQAQTLRDEQVGGNVLEIRRSDGTVSRYDRASGAFIAFNADGTIRTFFKPNNGEAYFRRQASLSH
ncbi:MAG: hypothetical protein ABI035_08055 [Gemmatimonadaceae bacterium]